jgi:hypothetical protein
MFIDLGEEIVADAMDSKLDLSERFSDDIAVHIYTDGKPIIVEAHFQ